MGQTRRAGPPSRHFLADRDAFLSPRYEGGAGRPANPPFFGFNFKKMEKIINFLFFFKDLARASPLLACQPAGGAAPTMDNAFYTGNL